MCALSVREGCLSLGKMNQPLTLGGDSDILGDLLLVL